MGIGKEGRKKRRGNRRRPTRWGWAWAGPDLLWCRRKVENVDGHGDWVWSGIEEEGKIKTMMGI